MGAEKRPVPIFLPPSLCLSGPRKGGHFEGGQDAANCAQSRLIALNPAKKMIKRMKNEKTPAYANTTARQGGLAAPQPPGEGG
jgi:hypothetical protein